MDEQATYLLSKGIEDLRHRLLDSRRDTELLDDCLRFLDGFEDLKAENEAITEARDEAESTASNLRNELDDLQQEVNKLQAKVDDLETSSAHSYHNMITELGDLLGAK